MKNLIILAVLICISTNICAQNQLIWSNDFDLENNGSSGKDPKIKFSNDSIFVTDKVNRDSHSMLLILTYNLDGDLISQKEIGQENNDTTWYMIIDFVEDDSGNFYITKNINVGYNKDKFVIGRYNDEGDEIWKRQQFSTADTSFRSTQISNLKDSFLLVSYVKSFGYPLDATQIDSNTTTQQVLFSCYDINGINIWNLDLESNNSYTMLNNENSWIFLENSANPNIIQVNADGSHSILQNYDFYIGSQNIQMKDNNKVVFSNSLYYRFNLLNLESGEATSFEYPTNLPTNNFGDRIGAITQDDEGDIYTTGRHYGTGFGTPSYTNCDVLTLKFDPDGNLEWENRYVYGSDNCEIGNVVKVQGDYVYVGGGSANSGTPSPFDYFVLKLDKETGELVGTYRYDAGANSHDYVTDLMILNDGSIVLTGLTDPASWTTQYLSDIILNTKDQNKPFLVHLFPNPVRRKTNLKWVSNEIFNDFEIYSLFGELVQKGNLSANQSVRIDLASGAYFIKLNSDKYSYSTKIMVVE